MTTTTRTPLLLYVLAALVVGGVYFVWRENRLSGDRLQARWEQVELNPEEIKSGLASEQLDPLGHALVQLAKKLPREENKLPPGFLDSIWSRLDELSRHEDSSIRERLTPVLAYAQDERATPLLKSMLEDPEKRVELNAAIALAARNDDSGADVLKEAIAGTKGEQMAQRRSLLLSFRYVAAPRHREFLQEELERAQLDRDEERASYCRDALERIEKRDN